MGFEKILKRLQRLPKNERYLARGVYVFRNNSCGCALGKVLPSLYNTAKTLSLNRMDIGAVFDLVHDVLDGNGGTKEERSLAKRFTKDIERLGIDEDSLDDLQQTNDCFGAGIACDPKNLRRARYNYIVAWLKWKVHPDVYVSPTPETFLAGIGKIR
jgi:hypothetical protein